MKIAFPTGKLTGMSGYGERFQEYFSRDVAERAAKSLSNGVEIEIRVSASPEEVFTFTREAKKNRVLLSPAKSPQVLFTLTPAAADAILADNSDDIGALGVGIGKLIVSSDPARKASVQIKAGFFSLFTNGYFGVITAGGGAFASFLASKGLNGIDAIKAMLKRART